MIPAAGSPSQLRGAHTSHTYKASGPRTYWSRSVDEEWRHRSIEPVLKPNHTRVLPVIDLRGRGQPADELKSTARCGSHNTAATSQQVSWPHSDSIKPHGRKGNAKNTENTSLLSLSFFFCRWVTSNGRHLHGKQISIESFFVSFNQSVWLLLFF